MTQSINRGMIYVRLVKGSEGSIYAVEAEGSNRFCGDLEGSAVAALRIFYKEVREIVNHPVL